MEKEQDLSRMDSQCESITSRTASSVASDSTAELIAVLKDFVVEFNGDDYDEGLWPLMDKARAAIAKAEF